MKTQMQTRFVSQFLLIFTGIPLLFWALGDLPLRSFLKEFLSVITILGFCQMTGLFFWSRTNRTAVRELKLSRLLKLHEIIGYTCATVLFFHPFFLVVPRFFEGGITPLDAFVTMITTSNPGVILGIIAWLPMVLLGVTALLRKKLPVRYAAWRRFHGVTAVLFVITGAWHAITLGRHSDTTMTILMIVLTACSVRFLLKNYFLLIFHKDSEA